MAITCEAAGEQAAQDWTPRRGGGHSTHSCPQASARGPDPRVGVLMGASVHRASVSRSTVRVLCRQRWPQGYLATGVLAQDLLHQGLAGQDPGPQVRDTHPGRAGRSAGFLCLQLPEANVARSQRCGLRNLGRRDGHRALILRSHPWCPVQEGRLNSSPTASELSTQDARAPSAQVSRTAAGHFLLGNKIQAPGATGGQ